MRKLFIVLIYFVLILPIAAQSKSDSFLYWNDRKIEWKDFQGIAPIYVNNYSSEIKYGIGYRTYDKEVNDVQFKWLETYSYMDKTSSWVIEKYKKPEFLLYNQVIFNIAELYSRKMQHEINSVSGTINEVRINLDEILKRTQEQCNNRVANFAVSSEYGTKSRIVDYWFGKIESELKADERNEYPPFSISDWGYGITFDFGYGILTSSSKDYFSNPVNMAFGFDIQYKSALFFLRAIVGFNKVKQPFLDGKDLWPIGLKTGLAVADLSVGYPLLFGKRIVFTPFIGLGYIEYSSMDQSAPYKDYIFGNVAMTLGVNCDYIFNQKIDFLNDVFSMGKSHWLVRTRITAAPYNFSNGINGWSYNFTVGLGIFGNSIYK